ncbi:MAG: hypothetical protein BYD32DRAFT_192895 [Podila humilis]|nr:MAG: hypothetical protein BYD32DRAFT_192895 [Podila humilis]
MTKLSALLLLVPYFVASVAAQGQGTIGNSDCPQTYDPTHDYFSYSKVTGKLKGPDPQTRGAWTLFLSLCSCKYKCGFSLPPLFFFPGTWTKVKMLFCRSTVAQTRQSVCMRERNTKMKDGGGLLGSS